MSRSSPLLFKRKISCLDVLCETNLFIQADPLRLEQIILNLLDNAKKYSQEGAQVALKGWKNKNSIHLTIQDNGKGIPEDDIPYIFNRFYRVDKSRTRSLGGTGLGLAIVKELVHAHGAEITVKSKENVGTEFELIFKEDRRMKTILLVDDEPMMLDLLSLYLSPLGYNCIKKNLHWMLLSI